MCFPCMQLICFENGNEEMQILQYRSKHGPSHSGYSYGDPYSCVRDLLATFPGLSLKKRDPVDRDRAEDRAKPHRAILE